MGEYGNVKMREILNVAYSKLKTLNSKIYYYVRNYSYHNQRYTCRGG